MEPSAPSVTRTPPDLTQLLIARASSSLIAVIRDMKIVLDKISAGRLNTNSSVAAVSGMRGAIAGIEAVENRTLSGKIVVYPGLPEMELIPLPELEAVLPAVYAKLEAGGWSQAAEAELQGSVGA